MIGVGNVTGKSKWKVQAFNPQVHDACGKAIYSKCLLEKCTNGFYREAKEKATPLGSNLCQYFFKLPLCVCMLFLARGIFRE